MSQTKSAALAHYQAQAMLAVAPPPRRFTMVGCSQCGREFPDDYPEESAYSQCGAHYSEGPVSASEWANLVEADAERRRLLALREDEEDRAEAAHQSRMDDQEWERSL